MPTVGTDPALDNDELYIHPWNFRPGDAGSASASDSDAALEAPWGSDGDDEGEDAPSSSDDEGRPRGALVAGP